MRPVIDVVLPARDESLTVAANVGAALACRYVREVIVVDDGSTDDTGERAAAAGAKVLRRDVPGGIGSKAQAMAMGVSASDADAILFVDGRADMSIGAFDYGPFWNPQVRRWPPLSGERIVGRELFEAIPSDKLDGYTIEVRLNEVVAERRLRTSVRTMKGVSHRTKRDKLGRIEGIRQTWHMYRSLLALPLTGGVRKRTYLFYLRGLTVER